MASGDPKLIWDVERDRRPTPLLDDDVTIQYLLIVLASPPISHLFHYNH